MKVLWLCNIVTPFFSREFGFRERYFGGWIEALINHFVATKEIELSVCLPIYDPINMKDGEKEGVFYYSFLFAETNEDIIKQTGRFEEILADVNPDVIHIWGTEYAHACSLVRACENMGLLNRVTIHTQGLVSQCCKIYKYGLPDYIFTAGGSNEDEYQSLVVAGEREIQVIKKVCNISGRTEWDRMCTSKINPNMKYYHIQEMLRKPFYNNISWNINNCKAHKIFISQAAYPLKGLHTVLFELSLLREKYTDLEISIAGPNIFEINSQYGEFLRTEMNRLGMEGYVHSLGTLKPELMIEELKAANVFLSCSVIENSSNSIGEAMLVGTPVVASNVGGTPSVVDNGNVACLYSLGNIHEVYSCIDRIFSDGNFAENLSKREIEYAHYVYNPDRIISDTLNMYSEIADNLYGD